MTRAAYVSLFLAAGLGLSGPSIQGAAASTLTNGDSQGRTITVIKGADRHTQEVEGGVQVKALCPDGCIVRLDNDPERDFILEGRERVTIEDGLLYYDGEILPEALADDSVEK